MVVLDILTALRTPVSGRNYRRIEDGFLEHPCVGSYAFSRNLLAALFQRSLSISDERKLKEGKPSRGSSSNISNLLVFIQPSSSSSFLYQKHVLYCTENPFVQE
jgi:hypothetical protein